MVDLDVLAKGLRHGDRIRLLNSVHGIKLPRYSTAAIRRLCELGFAKATKRSSRGPIAAKITPSGSALRAHLKDIQDG